MSYNQTTSIVGNLTSDPELRFTPDGHAVTDLRVAVNNRVKTEQGEWIDAPADFYTIPVWNTEAENVAETCRKGTRITATGTTYTRTWTDTDGAQRFQTVLKPTMPIGISLDYQRATVTKATRTNTAAE